MPQQSSRRRPGRPQTIVLVHGAWHGGWCWRRVAPLLGAAGAVVTTPTMTGLGERAHPLSKSVRLSTFTDDICNHIHFEDLTDVVLVGHSFGGLVVTGVADRMPERLRSLVFLDALILERGESWGSHVPANLREDRIRLAETSSGSVSLPAPLPAAFGVERPEDVAWVEAKLTPHPFGCFNDPLTLKNPLGNGLPCAYLPCVDPAYPALRTSHERGRAHGWPILELATGHDAMVSAPQATAARILEAAEMLGGH